MIGLLKRLILATCALCIFTSLSVAEEVNNAEPDILKAALGEMENLSQIVSLRAHIVPKHYTTLSAEMDGVIDMLDVREGGTFADKETLIGLRCDEERSQLVSSRASHELTSRKFGVQKRLDKLGSTSIMKTEMAKADAVVAKSELDQASARVRKCNVVAPFSGRVSNLYVQRHQYVKRGDELARIVDPSVLEVEMIVPSDWLQWLKLGYPFQVDLDETGRAHKAVVTALGAWIDPVSRSIKVSGQVIGDTDRLLPGMSGKAVIEPPKI